MSDVGLIVASAGAGTRLGSDEEKALVPLLGKPILAWTLLAFDDFHEIGERVVVVPPGREQSFRERVLDPLDLQREVELIAGGKERQDSVANGLAVWFRAGIEGARKDIALTMKTLERFGLDRYAGYRGLAALESARLISVRCRHGASPRVTIRKAGK